MKRFTALCLAASMMFALAACGGSKASSAQPASTAPAESGSTASTPPPAEGQVTLNLWHHNTAETRQKNFTDAIARFESENPDIKVNITVLENDPYKTKLKTVINTDDAPDVFHSWGGGWLKSFVDEGLVYDITDDFKEWEGDLNQAVIPINTFDGKVYASPYANTGTFLYYNKTIFEENNITPPATYEELMKACETLKGAGVIPFALGNSSKWPGAQHFVLMSMRIGGPDVFQKALDGGTTFEDPAFIQAGDNITDMVKKGYFPEGVNGINYDTGGSRMMFYTGQCAMIIQTSNFLNNCKSENEEFFNNNLGVMLYPAFEGKPGKATDILGGENAFSVSAKSKSPEAAVKLVRFLSTDEQFQQESADGGILPAKKGIVTKDPLVSQAIEMMGNATFMQNYIDQTLPLELAEKHKDTVQALFGGTMTSEEAAKEMQTLFESLG